MNRKKLYYTIVPVIILIASFLFISKKDEEKTVVPLNVSFRYFPDEKKITVRNCDTVDFVHAELVIDKYYKLSGMNLLKDETYEFWLAEFVHYNKNHYPVKQNPRLFSVWSELNNGKNGFYSKKIVP